MTKVHCQWTVMSALNVSDLLNRPVQQTFDYIPDFNSRQQWRLTSLKVILQETNFLPLKRSWKFILQIRNQFSSIQRFNRLTRLIVLFFNWQGTFIHLRPIIAIRNHNSFRDNGEIAFKYVTNINVMGK